MMQGNSSTNMIKLKQTWWNSTYPMSQSKHGNHFVVGTPQGNNDIFADIKEIAYNKKRQLGSLRIPCNPDRRGRKRIKALFPELLNLEKVKRDKALHLAGLGNRNIC